MSDLASRTAVAYNQVQLGEQYSIWPSSVGGEKGGRGETVRSGVSIDEANIYFALRRIQ